MSIRNYTPVLNTAQDAVGQRVIAQFLVAMWKTQGAQSAPWDVENGSP
jgi:hypothetical protein